MAIIFVISTLGCLNHALYSYVIVGHIYNFDSWRNRSKNLVNAKHGLSLLKYGKT